MVTNRTPIDRPPTSRISPAAVDAFKKMLKLEARCRCKPRDWSGKYWEHETRKACDQWSEQISIMCRELKLPPWEATAYEHPGAATQYPAGSYAAENDKPNLGAKTRYRILCEAAGIEATEENA